jgi:dTDP-4-amino-4,6-dideoxygalactose transaminase
MASMLGNFGPGDEVILPSYTFTSAATAVTQFGATPVFVDIDPVTKGIDPNQVEEAITDRTVAISWVNYAGVAPDIEALQYIAKMNDLLLIEDNAHGLGGSYKGKPLGSFGDFATQSFHATKNIQCGEGGALIINNPKYIDRAEIIREKGTDRSKFIRGEVQKYQWMDKGSSYLMAEVISAILLGQLENFQSIQSSRSTAWEWYFRSIVDCPDFQVNPIQSKQVSHMFYITVKNETSRERLVDYLKGYGVQAVSHYQNLSKSKAGKIFSPGRIETTQTQKISSRILRLPLWAGISEEECLRAGEIINKMGWQVE